MNHLEDGHGWGKWWKKAWNNFVQAIRHPFDIKGQWNNLVGEANQPGIAPITSAVITVVSFAFMQPELMFTTAMWTSTAASAGSAAFLQSPAGQNLTDWTGQNIYDNILGMRPSTARIWATIDLSMTSSYLIERSIANIIADPVQKVPFDSNKHTIEGDSYQGKMFGPNPSGGRFKTNELWALMQNGEQVGTVGGARVGALGLDGPLSFLQIDHTGINLRGLKNAAKINPYAYLTSGVCHTGTNISLLNAGFSSTVTSLGVGGWSTYLSTGIYGNYGGGLYRSVFNGYNSDYRGRDR